MLHVPARLPEISLSPKRREMARQLWDLCSHGSTPAELIAGRQALKEAPEDIRSAVLAAYGRIWSQGRDPQFGKNPFE